MCTADQRSRPLLSTRIVCSIRYSTLRPAVLRMRWTYEGHSLTTFSRKVIGVGGYALKFDTGGPTMPLPGGAYVCTFTLGSAHARATLLSNGPTGDVVDIEICTIENAFKYGNFPVCKADGSAAPISGGSAIVCDGVLPNATGRNVALRFTAADGTVVSQGRTTAISQPMQQNYASVSTSALHAGTTYSCQFTFDGAVAAEKQFTVAP
jgi:hypothetical protein